MSIKDSIKDLAPWYLRNRVAGTMLESIGAVLDGGIEALTQGIRATNPLKCPEDAIPLLAFQRGMRWYPTEPEASIRYRLSRWRQARRLKGSHHGTLRQLQPYFLPQALPRIRIVHQSGDGATATWHTLEPSGSYSVVQKTPSNWNWDGAPEQWSRWWVIVYMDGLSYQPAIQYSAGELYNAGNIWSGGLLASQIADLVSICEDWKAAHSALWGIILANDQASFDPLGSGAGYPNGQWGFTIDNLTGQPVRLLTAIYAYDRGQAQPIL